MANFRLKAFLVVVLGVGSFLGGYFNDEWFGQPLKYALFAIGLMVWTYRDKAFWPKGGVQEWQQRKSMGLLKYLVSGWFLWGLAMGTTMGPIIYALSYFSNNTSSMAPFHDYMFRSFSSFMGFGLFLQIWGWVACELHSVKESKGHPQV
ncbi:MAG: hypothetical protein KY445_16655 [Armatimonadetes bacterium]|nr:hypothetical protein [Armatimonadota bacterium]